MGAFSGERIAKIMARAGVCSRRDAERLIAAGRVRVNGAVIDSPALNVTAQDKVEVDGVEVKQVEETRLFLYHKPAGLVTSARDEKGRETVFDHLPRDLPRVVSVGRLDLNTEGLLLLTNDGGLSRYMELPQQRFRRTYRVRVLGAVTQERLDRLKNGVTVDGVHYGPVEAHLEDGTRDSANHWIVMTIAEGKNREVRKIMESLGLRVNRLIRLSYGPFALEDLPLGRVIEVPRDEMRALLPGYFKDT
jgi:23S rRNA pseudouridine2605 synthase